ncbi:unnamed protein product [Cylicocyclus nassatus]|uniref:Uncharacterized protein n=1 Tax=Cylicocyclus nassatus TaxID=53992 RepID=A0AA36M3Y4_CYLNA|nr:unnamed protein product [Cylicocyclus nassatus]
MSKILVPPYRRIIAEEARSHEANLHVLIAEMLRTFSYLLEHYTPRCESLPKMWLGLGAYVYKWIASPTQGLWMAITLCALGSAPTYYGFFTTASFLQNYADSTRLHYTQARRRRRKCKYVQDALARRKLFPSGSVITTKHTGSRSVVTETPLSTSVPTSSVTRKSIRNESFRKVKQKNPSKSHSTSREIIKEEKRSTMTPGSRSSRQEPTGKSAPRENSPFGTPLHLLQSQQVKMYLKED